MQTKSRRVDFLKEHLVKIQVLMGVTKSSFMLEFGKYQTDVNFDHLVQMLKIMQTLSEFEAEILEKFSEYVRHESDYDPRQIALDLETVQNRLKIFIATIKYGPAKDQFVNVKPLDEYKV